MRVLLTGGGTGGHIYPILAAARHIMKKDPRADILFVGTKRGLESQIVPSAGFKLKTITVRGFPRKLSPELFKAAADLTRGGLEAYTILKEYQPQVVLGSGGYVCGPVVLCSSLMGIPSLIHEQNVIPGATNKILSRMVKKICVSFAASEKYFLSSKEKVVVTGNPRASEVVGPSREEGIKALRLNPNKKTVLIVSGSRGAKKINRCVLEILQDFKACPNLQFIYITGQEYYEKAADDARKKGAIPSGNIFLVPYIEEMPLALAAADLIISRAGATTLAEITARGIPAVLVPSPNVTNNHQVLNARVLSDAGAAELIIEDELTGSVLMEKIIALTGNENILTEMSAKSKKLGRPDSADMIYGLLKECI